MRYALDTSDMTRFNMADIYNRGLPSALNTDKYYMDGPNLRERPPASTIVHDYPYDPNRIYADNSASRQLGLLDDRFRQKKLGLEQADEQLLNVYNMMLGQFIPASDDLNYSIDDAFYREVVNSVSLQMDTAKFSDYTQLWQYILRQTNGGIYFQTTVPTLPCFVKISNTIRGQMNKTLRVIDIDDQLGKYGDEATKITKNMIVNAIGSARYYDIRNVDASDQRIRTLVIDGTLYPPGRTLREALEKLYNNSNLKSAILITRDVLPKNPLDIAIQIGESDFYTYFRGAGPDDYEKIIGNSTLQPVYSSNFQPAPPLYPGWGPRQPGRPSQAIDNAAYEDPNGSTMRPEYSDERFNSSTFTIGQDELNARVIELSINYSGDPEEQELQFNQFSTYIKDKELTEVFEYALGEFVNEQNAIDNRASDLFANFIRFKEARPNDFLMYVNSLENRDIDMFLNYLEPNLSNIDASMRDAKIEAYDKLARKFEPILAGVGENKLRDYMEMLINTKQYANDGAAAMLLNMNLVLQKVFLRAFDSGMFGAFVEDYNEGGTAERRQFIELVMKLSQDKEAMTILRDRLSSYEFEELNNLISEYERTNQSNLPNAPNNPNQSQPLAPDEEGVDPGVAPALVSESLWAMKFADKPYGKNTFDWRGEILPPDPSDPENLRYPGDVQNPRLSRLVKYMAKTTNKFKFLPYGYKLVSDGKSWYPVSKPLQLGYFTWNQIEGRWYFVTNNGAEPMDFDRTNIRYVPIRVGLKRSRDTQSGHTAEVKVENIHLRPDHKIEDLTAAFDKSGAGFGRLGGAEGDPVEDEQTNPDVKVEDPDGNPFDTTLVGDNPNFGNLSPISPGQQNNSTYYPDAHDDNPYAMPNPVNINVNSNNAPDRKLLKKYFPFDEVVKLMDQIQTVDNVNCSVYFIRQE